MKVLIATDCLPAAEQVIHEAAARPWPRGTAFLILNVVNLHRFAGLPRLMEESNRNHDQLAVVMKKATAKLERGGHRADTRVAEGFHAR